MGVGCYCETKNKRKENIKQKTQRLITKIEAQIQVLINEIKDLNYKVKTDDGNITNQEK